jgi:6-phosphogluconolactonase
MSNQGNEILIYDDVTTLAGAAAKRIGLLADEAIEARGVFHVALAGGTTPRRLYETLALPDHALGIDWSRVHVFFGDERCVPPDDPESNYGMARASLLDKVPLAETHIHRIAAEGIERDGAASEYAACLRQVITARNGDVPAIDLVLLGIGPDGHIASLFPDTGILHETRRLVVPVFVKQKHAWRISITFPVINSARDVMVLATGGGKAEILGQILGGHSHDLRYPAEMIAHERGVHWYLDRDAARELTASRL